MNQEIKQVTKIKNPKRVAASKKSYQERMLKMKKEILENAGSNDTNGSNDGSNDIKSDNDGSNESTNDIMVVVPIILSQIMMYIFMVGGGY